MDLTSAEMNEVLDSFLWLLAELTEHSAGKPLDEVRRVWTVAHSQALLSKLAN
jgi:hypothetical protein